MSIYVISNEINAQLNQFKIGQTQCDLVELERRKDAQVYLWYNSENHIKDETKLLKKFKSFKTASEWLEIPFDKLKKELDKYFDSDGSANVEAQRTANPITIEKLQSQNEELRKKVEHLRSLLREKNTLYETEMKRRQSMYVKEIEKQKTMYEIELREVNLTAQVDRYLLLLLADKVLEAKNERETADG